MSQGPRLQRILCPVDLSDASRRAFHYGMAIGRMHQASVRVVQVVDMGAWSGPRVAGVFEMTEKMRATLEEELSWWAAREMNGDTAPVTELREGPVVPALVQAARDANADLIVMGSHGKSGFERLTIGSVTEKLLRKAPCPVLVVPARERATQRFPLRRVLCATDFSAPSARAVDHARLFADTSGAPLSLVTVIDWPFGETKGSDPVSMLRRNLEAEAAASLQTLAARDADARPAEIIVRHGKPGREILHAARECEADLIVLGVSGRGAVDLALLGSTAHHVLRDAPCPVLAVPAPNQA